MRIASVEFLNNLRTLFHLSRNQIFPKNTRQDQETCQHRSDLDLKPINLQLIGTTNLRIDHRTNEKSLNVSSMKTSLKDRALGLGQEENWEILENSDLRASLRACFWPNCENAWSLGVEEEEEHSRWEIVKCLLVRTWRRLLEEVKPKSLATEDGSGLVCT